MNKILTTLALFVSFATIGSMILAAAPAIKKADGAKVAMRPNDPPEGPPWE